MFLREQCSKLTKLKARLQVHITACVFLRIAPLRCCVELSLRALTVHASLLLLCSTLQDAIEKSDAVALLVGLSSGTAGTDTAVELEQLTDNDDDCIDDECELVELPAHLSCDLSRLSPDMREEIRRERNRCVCVCVCCHTALIPCVHLRCKTSYNWFSKQAIQSLCGRA
jgi:hypothetical protein